MFDLLLLLLLFLYKWENNPKLAQTAKRGQKPGATRANKPRAVREIYVYPVNDCVFSAQMAWLLRRMGDNSQKSILFSGPTSSQLVPFPSHMSFKFTLCASSPLELTISSGLSRNDAAKNASCKHTENFNGHATEASDGGRRRR